MKKLTLFLIVLLFLQITACKNDNKKKIIKRDNAEINYNLSGKGDTALLFVHGSYINQSYWKEQVNFFKDKYTVVTMDLPGHGKSEKDRKDWSLDGFEEDVNTVIIELNLKNVILMGHSMGADINLITSTSHPKNIIGFIAIDYFKNAATAPDEKMQEQIEGIKQNLKTDFAKTNKDYANMVLLTPQTPPAISERIIKDYRNAYETMGIPITNEIFESYKKQILLLPKLKLKLYLINVDYMPTNEQPLKQYAVNGYAIIHIKGTCHFPMIENPEDFNKFLRQTIYKISKGK
jgi:pimeloyl-ACP methyl ester carboxylesterase